MIYFVRAASGEGLIKIGHTDTAFAQRIEQLQRGSPVLLVVLALIEGSRADEYDLHERFEAERMYGEWFTPTSGLLSLIAEARESTPSEWIDYRRPERPKKCRAHPSAARRREWEEEHRRATSFDDSTTRSTP